jgi:hypothetical protein
MINYLIIIYMLEIYMTLRMCDYNMMLSERLYRLCDCLSKYVFAHTARHTHRSIHGDYVRKVDVIFGAAT